MQKQLSSIGIDIAKNKFDACFLLNDGSNEIKTYENRDKGFESFIQRIKDIDKNIPIVVESTGDFHIPLCLRVKRIHKVYLINPLTTKKYARGSIRKQKSDKIDCEILAKIGLMEEMREFVMEEKTIINRKKLILGESLKKKLQSMELALNNFEELNKKLGLETELKEIKKSIKEVKKQVKRLEEVENKEEIVEKVSKIKGISKITAVKILTMLEGKEFKSKRSVCAYAGLDVGTKLSGESIHIRGKISKRGNSLLRGTLFQGAWGLFQHNEEFKKIYEYYKSKGRHYYECLIIMARKLINVIYGMMRSGKEYDPEKIKVPNLN